jgi:uncharacterized membrane protein
MTALVLAALFFVGIHLLIAGTTVRDGLIARLGAGPYRGAFSLASLIGIVWLALAYRGAPYVPLWGKLVGLEPIALAVMLVATVLVVVGQLVPSPTAVGGERVLARGAGPVGLQRITRHPFLWGVALWAAVHLTVNGDVASLVLFGSLGLLALLGTASIDAKRARALGPAWTAFAAQSSNLPFLAIVQGRTKLALGEHKAWHWLAALAVYALLVGLHGPVFGVSPLPR